MRFDMALPKDGGALLDLEFDLLNFQYVSLSTGTSFLVVGEETAISAFSVLRVAFPNKYVSPYIGTGIGEHLIFPEDGIKGFDDFLTMFKHKDQVYGIAQAGILFFTVLDVRYNMYFTDLFSKNPERSSTVSFGFSFPLRDYKFKRKVITRFAQITQAGTLEAQKFLEPNTNVDKIFIYESSAVGGFEGYSKLEEIIFS